MMEKIADAKSVPSFLRYLGVWALVGMVALAASMLKDVRDGLNSLQRQFDAKEAADTVRREQAAKDQQETARRLAILEQKSFSKPY